MKSYEADKFIELLEYLITARLQISELEQHKTGGDLQRAVHEFRERTKSELRKLLMELES